MAKIRKSGRTGHGKADDVEIVAGEMGLRIHARHFQHAVRIARQQRPSGRGPLRSKRPVVAAAGHFGFLPVLAAQQRFETGLEVGERREIARALGAGWNAQHVIAAIVEPQFRYLLRADDRQRRRAPQLPPYRTHQESDLAHHRDRMPRLPCCRLGAENGVFRRPCTLPDEGVDAACIGFEHRLGVFIEQCEIALRGARGVELPGQHVAGQRRFSDPLRVAAGAPAQQRFHLPEPVLRMREAEPGKSIEMRGRTDMRDAPGVASQIDLAGQSGHRRRAVEVRQMAL